MASCYFFLPLKIMAYFYSRSPQGHILKTVREAFECMSQKIAEERIQRLFELADKRVSGDREDEEQLADRYVKLARDIGMKYNVSVPADLRKQYCHNCLSFLKPGVNCRVRINSKNDTVNYECRKCGEVNRYGF